MTPRSVFATHTTTRVVGCLQHKTTRATPKSIYAAHSATHAASCLQHTTTRATPRSIYATHTATHTATHAACCLQHTLQHTLHVVCNTPEVVQLLGLSLLYILTLHASLRRDATHTTQTFSDASSRLDTPRVPSTLQHTLPVFAVEQRRNATHRDV